MNILSFIKRIKWKFKKVSKCLWWKIEYGDRISVPSSISFRDRFLVNIDREGILCIGNYVFFNNDCSINCHKAITIGDDCIFGENVKIYDHNHVFNTDNMVRLEKCHDGEVVVGNNCWIGSNVVLLKGTNIGNDCVIAAGCTINSAIPSGTLVRREDRILYEKIKKQGED